MDEAMAARYWCHRCSRIVHPIMEIDIQCPHCASGFVEEMSGGAGDSRDPDSDFGSDRALSLWAPILLGMMGNTRRRRRFRRRELGDDDDDDNDDVEERYGAYTEIDREIESILRRRRRSSAAILQLLQGIRAGMASESEISEGDRDRDRDRDTDTDRDRDRDRERERARVISINPFNQTIIVQGSYDSSNGPVGSLGDYFIGPGLDLLLQHLAENDPNRYGTPPAQKEAIEALATVTIKETLQCSVCLDDFEIGTEAKEMPCKHKFHSGCLLPWLELHSSCPVCRHQLPADESKLESERSRNSSNPRESDNHNSESNSNTGHASSAVEGDGEGRNGGRRLYLPWPFSNLFSSSGSQSNGNNSSSASSSSSSSSANAPGSASQTDEN